MTAELETDLAKLRGLLTRKTLVTKGKGAVRIVKPDFFQMLTTDIGAKILSFTSPSDLTKVMLTCKKVYNAVTSNPEYWMNSVDYYRRQMAFARHEQKRAESRDPSLPRC